MKNSKHLIVESNISNTQKKYVISDSQAREFANSIFRDIQKYIKEHQEEYEEYLEQENNMKNNSKEVIG